MLVVALALAIATAGAESRPLEPSMSRRRYDQPRGPPRLSAAQMFALADYAQTNGDERAANKSI